MRLSLKIDDGIIKQLNKGVRLSANSSGGIGDERADRGPQYRDALSVSDRKSLTLLVDCREIKCTRRLLHWMRLSPQSKIQSNEYRTRGCRESLTLFKINHKGIFHVLSELRKSSFSDNDTVVVAEWI